MSFLSAIVGWSLRNRPIVLVVAVLVVALGARAAWLLPLDAMPDLTGVQVEVVTSAPALSPIEIEQFVSVPLERMFAGTPGSTEIRSISKYGFSMVTVVFRDDVDIYRARQLVDERLRSGDEAVVTRYGRPQLGQISSALGEVFQFVVRNDRLGAMKTRELLDWYIAPQLRTVAGVVDISTQGGEDREYQVVLDPALLAASAISVPEVVSAIEAASGNAGGGYIETNREQLVIGTQGLMTSLDDLRRVVIASSPAGVPITIASLGEVRFGPRLRRGAASRDAEGEVVVGVALMLRDENALAVSEAVKAKLEAIRPSLPPGTSIEPFYDRSQLVGHTIKTVGRNLVEGAVLVIVVLLLLLGSLRAGLVVAATIPLALLIAVIAMHAAGVSGNLMSLGAIDFGLLVDGAVIIVENAMRRLTQERARIGRDLVAEERIAVVRDATTEVRAASIYGEVIIAVVYLPILGLVGTSGKLFHPLAATVLFALGGAVVLSLTLVPVLASFALRPAATAREPLLFRIAAAAYRPALAWIERHRWIAITVGISLLTVAVGLFLRLGTDFVPQLDEGDLLIEVHRLPGVALTESLAIDKRTQRSIREVPEVAHVVGRLGGPEFTTDPMGIDQTDVYVQFRPRAGWTRGKDEIVSDIAHRLERDVPEIVFGMSQPIEMRTNELLAGIRSDVAAIVYGDDLDQLVALGGRIARVLRSVPGAADVRVEQIAGLRYLRIVPDRRALERSGVTVAEINTLAESLAVGANAGDVREGERRFELVVKTRLVFDGDLERVRALPVKATTGEMVRLGDVADVRIEDGPAEINRANHSRRLLVEMNVRGRSLVDLVADARAAVATRVALPPGYRVEWGGQFESYVAGRARLLVIVPIALALIIAILWLAFRSLSTALVIFLGVPFAVVGGVIGLAVRDIPFSISAGVGFIALSGVAILNSLVMISAAHRLEQDGLARVDAMRAAAHERLRPVLMTALVAALGFLPMALSTAPGSEIQRPLATVVIGGMFSSPVLTLLILPAIFGMRRRRSARASDAGSVTNDQQR